MAFCCQQYNPVIVGLAPMESDKVNYVLSSVFFLANRLAKCTIGLSELDKAIGNVEKIGKVSVDEKKSLNLAM